MRGCANWSGASPFVYAFSAFLSADGPFVSIGWLEPLVSRIGENQTSVIVPVIDTIADDTLQYGYQGGSSVYVGGFDWGLLFNWHPIPDNEMKRIGYKKHIPVRYTFLKLTEKLNGFDSLIQ